MNAHTQPRTATRFFLSYERDDAAFVDRLSEALKRNGLIPVDPSSEFEAGSKMEEAILRALRSADRVVFIVPRREGGGKSALAEIGAARALGKDIIAVMPDGSRAWNSDVARALSEDHVIDASRLEEGRLVDVLAS